MRSHHEALIERAREWVRKNACSFPLDLYAEMFAAGLDATKIEEELLLEKETVNNGN